MALSESTQATSQDDLSLLIAAGGIVDAGSVQAVREGLRVLQEFLAAFNARDAQRWSRTLQYPHVRLSAGEVRLWQTPEDYVATNDVQDFAATGWAYSRWDWIRPVQASAEKAHFALQFTRYSADERPIGSYQALYVVTKKDGRWGVQARSSYAGVTRPGAAF